MTVAASAGAQLDFSTLTIATWSVGKATYYGFNAAYDGSMSNTTLEFGNGTTYTCTSLQDEGTQFGFTFSGSGITNTDTAAFKRIIIGDQTFSRPTFSGANNAIISTSDDVLSGSVGSTIIVELRAD